MLIEPLRIKTPFWRPREKIFKICCTTVSRIRMRRKKEDAHDVWNEEEDRGGDVYTHVKRMKKKLADRESFSG